MATTTISAMTAVLAGNLDDTAVFAVDDKNLNTRKATVAQLRTQLFAATGIAITVGAISGTTIVTTATIKAGGGAFTGMSGGDIGTARTATEGLLMIGSDGAVSIYRSAATVNFYGMTTAIFPGALTAGAISGTTIAASGFTTLNGGVQFTGAAGASTGSGIEISYSAGVGGSIASINRTGASYTTLTVDGSTFTVNISGAPKLAVAATGVVTLAAYTAATFVAGDKYLVVDAAGVVHRSAVGPAS